MRSVLILALLGALALADTAAARCKPDTSYAPVIDPARFVDQVDNPLWPLVPGTTTVLRGGGEVVTITVTDETRTILGVRCVVVRDVVTVDGEVEEDTADWFAQDVDGNVWYFGEDSRELRHGRVVGREGSWEAGVDGAQPGIVMHAVQPEPGVAYRQEYYACEAEDMAEVVGLGRSVTVPAGSYENCLETREYSPLEAGVSEHKFYAPGVGLVLEVNARTGARTELVERTQP
ncbi:MAG: hypothetical protein R3C71_11110 [Candidatus Krumholzibacteriia bacterium]|nr:hypothetical protein [Candidatus Latescibacterota bacterium]